MGQAQSRVGDEDQHPARRIEPGVRVCAALHLPSCDQNVYRCLLPAVQCRLTWSVLLVYHVCQVHEPLSR